MSGVDLLARIKSLAEEAKGRARPDPGHSSPVVGCPVARAAQAAPGEAIEPAPPPPPSPATDRLAAGERGPSASPPRHWTEPDEDEPPLAPSAARSLEAAELGKRANACQKIRALLRDGAWHGSPELADVGGMRFGARLLEIRRGADGDRPLDVEAEARPRGGRMVWFYRARGGGWRPA